MSCSHYPHQVYLYLSDELNNKERKVFEMHLTSCEACQQGVADATDVLGQLNSMPSMQPDPQRIKNILHVSRGRFKSEKKGKSIRSVIQKLLSPGKLVWEVAFSTAVIVLLIYVRPFQQVERGVPDDLLVWDDDFYVEADWVNQELNRVESGDLISSYINSETIGSVEDQTSWLSPMSTDLSKIREEVQDIVTGIYGI